MGTRYKVGDTVEIFGQSIFVDYKRLIVSKGIGVVGEVRGDGYFADYTQRRTYIIQLPNRIRVCFAGELKLIKRAKDGTEGMK